MIQKETGVSVAGGKVTESWPALIYKHQSKGEFKIGWVRGIYMSLICVKI